MRTEYQADPVLNAKRPDNFLYAVRDVVKSLLPPRRNLDCLHDVLSPIGTVFRITGMDVLRTLTGCYRAENWAGETRG
jgi:hypothetical protein